MYLLTATCNTVHQSVVTRLLSWSFPNKPNFNNKILADCSLVSLRVFSVLHIFPLVSMSTFAKETTANFKFCNFNILTHCCCSLKNRVKHRKSLTTLNKYIVIFKIILLLFCANKLL